jgi:amino acid adenylation domain-containing protein/thioester reductase-like protein
MILLDELRVLYPAMSLGIPASLPRLGVNYTDYVKWQAEMIAGPDGAAHLAYWQQQLAPELPVLDIPTDKPRPPFQTFHGAAHGFRLDEELIRNLKSIARANGVTLYVLLLAAFQVMLHRYTDQEDILVGSPMAGRSKAEFEAVVGYFINPVVLRANFSDDPGFIAFLQQVRQTVLGALEHQDYPFPILVERLQPLRDPSRSPLFQVMFNMPKAHRLEDQGAALFALGEADARMDFGAIEMELFPVEQQMAMFDMLLAMVEGNGMFSASLQYNTDLFDATTIARFVGHFQILLEAIAADPDRRVSSLPLATEAERRQLLIEWNDTESYRPALCAHQLFEAQVERTPNAVAVSYKDQRLTYRQLDDRANRMTLRLVERGVGPDLTVALMAERNIDFLIAVMAVFKAGGAYLPLDPYSPPTRLSQVIETSKPHLLLTASEMATGLARTLTEMTADRLPEVMSMDEPAADEGLEAGLHPRSDPRHLAYVIYTSGSTGSPKGAMVEHRGMLNHLHAKLSVLGLTDQDIVAQTASQCFDISVWQFFAALLVGGRVHVFDDEVARDPALLLEEVDNHQITILETVPSLLRAMVDEASHRGVARPALSTLRWMLITGEALPPELCEQWSSYYPHTSLLNAYGPTECSDDVTHYLIDRQSLAGMAHVPIGRPIANARLYILDRPLRPTPQGVPGELCVGGVSVGRGYLNDAARTADSFIPDPFGNEPGARIYRTGDLVRYRVDGNIEFLGRLDQQVKIRGFRIELGEVEALVRQHPEVREVVVDVDSSTPANERLVAYIVPNQQAPPSGRLLRSFLAERLPSYMIPSAFVFMEAIPLTPSGKVNRQALPGAESGGRELEEDFVAPGTPVEQELAAIWAKLLGTEEIGVHDNFFEIGGHSLLAVQLMSQVREAFNVNLPLITFFEAPTVARLAQAIDAESRGEGQNRISVMTAEELRGEAELDPAINAQALPAEDAADPSRVFLTGGTGFLGAYLLRSLLRRTDSTIYCLVRSRDAESGRARIRQALELYSLWDESYDPRIVPVAGDLSRPLLGLSTAAFQELASDVSAIYHNGALVNFLYPYSLLKGANVLGTQEVLRLASQTTLKPVHFVSTISVFASVTGSKDEEIREDASIDSVEELFDGYSQSKWVAEKLITVARSRGLPVSIFRPHWVTGDSQTGICSTDDLVFQLIRTCIHLGSFPDIDMMVDMVPVDYASDAIVHLSRQSQENVFHLVNPHPAHISDVIDWLGSFGYRLTRVPYETWVGELISRSERVADEQLRVLISLLSNRGLGEQMQSGATYSLARMGHLDARNTLTGLAGASVKCPPVDAQMIGTCVRHLTDVGFLPPLGTYSRL